MKWVGDLGEGLVKRSEVSQDCWTFRWWLETHGESSAAANASCPPGRSVKGQTESKILVTLRPYDISSTLFSSAAHTSSCCFISRTTCMKQSQPKSSLCQVCYVWIEKGLVQVALRTHNRWLGRNATISRKQWLLLKKQIKFVQSNLINNPPTQLLGSATPF